MMMYLIVVCFGLVLISQPALSAGAPTHNKIMSEIAAASYPKADFILRQLIVENKRKKEAEKNNALEVPGLTTTKFIKIHDGKVLVDISILGNGQEIFNALVSLGLEHASKYKNIVSGYIALDKVEALMAHSGVVFVNVSLIKTSVGLTTTQGDVSMHTDTARVNFGVDGSGVRVGTLSDSYDRLGGAAADVLSGDLPSGVIVVKELPLLDTSGTDEGRAMMQIIHDVAPGATLLFRTGAGGQADLAEGIVDLVNASSDVIVDDITFFDAPFFQDGIVAQAATNAIKSGVHYFSAAGNLNEHSYQAPFADSGVTAPVVGGTMHDFGGGDTFQTFTLPETPGDNVLLLIFQWNQPFQSACEGSCPGPTTNLDIYLRDQLSSTIVAMSEIDNVAAGAPFEVIQYVNSGIAPQALELFIVHRSGPLPTLIKYILPSGPSPDEYDTNSSTSFGQANGDRVIAVGSSAFFNTPAFGTDPAVSNNASSLGGTPIYFNSADNSALAVPLIRQTPDITGPDGGNNTFFGDDSVNDVDLFPNFFGTSAAAPHVAGLAALIIEESISKLSPAQMESILEITALDMGIAGYDYKSGFGLVQADGPFGALCGDIDGDSVCIDTDECPNDPDMLTEGPCGCGISEENCEKENDESGGGRSNEMADGMGMSFAFDAPPIAAPLGLSQESNAEEEPVPKADNTISEPRVEPEKNNSPRNPSSCSSLGRQGYSQLGFFLMILVILGRRRKKKYLA